MICSKLSIVVVDGEVTSLFPYVDNVDEGSVAFITNEGHRFVLDEKTLKRGLACLDSHRELLLERSRFKSNLNKETL